MKNKYEITVTVSGQTGTGKSTIASIVATALAEHGINFKVELLDGKLPNEVLTATRVDSLKNKGLHVTVTELQSIRELL